jgi:hypothetical protein
VKAWKAYAALFEDDDPAEPRYDPVHLAGVLIGVQVAAGALFWLLWTLLVYEGGIGASIPSLLRGDKGWDAHRGLWGHLCAFAILVAALSALHRSYFRKK